MATTNLFKPMNQHFDFTQLLLLGTAVGTFFYNLYHGVSLNINLAESAEMVGFALVVVLIKSLLSGAFVYIGGEIAKKYWKQKNK
jgi:hypothetical protein